MHVLATIPFLEHPLENWLFIIALAVIALVVFGVILLVSFVRNNVGGSNVSFDEAEIVKIQPVQKLKVSEPMPQSYRR